MLGCNWTKRCMVGDRCEKIDKGDENRTHNKPSSKQYERKKNSVFTFNLWWLANVGFDCIGLIVNWVEYSSKLITIRRHTNCFANISCSVYKTNTIWQLNCAYQVTSSLAKFRSKSWTNPKKRSDINRQFEFQIILNTIGRFFSEHSLCR